jgi:hypothetical protein
LRESRGGVGVAAANGLMVRTGIANNCSNN